MTMLSQPYARPNEGNDTHSPEPTLKPRSCAVLRRTRRTTLLVLLSLGLAAAGLLNSPSAALAHALLVRSDPPAGALLQNSPKQVHLWFTEDLNGLASSIVVWNRYRRVENIGHATVVPGHPREMTVGLRHLSAGSYLVLWTSVSAIDGHILHNYFLFSVKKRGPGPSLSGVSLSGNGQAFPDGATLVSITAHWVELMAAVVWVGCMAFTWLVLLHHTSSLEPTQLEVVRKRLNVLLPVTLISLLTASSGVILILGYDLVQGSWSSLSQSSTWQQIFGGQYGQLWVARQAIVLLFLCAWFLLLRHRTISALRASTLSVSTRLRRLWPEVASVVLGALYLYLFAASGHAAASEILPLDGSRILSGSVFVDWLHFIADALWLGGQAFIAFVLIRAIESVGPSTRSVRSFLDILGRFSPFAYASIAIFVLSGVFNADVRIPSFYAFLNSVYGRTLMVKVVLIGFMFLVSAFTVYLVRPYLRRLLNADDLKLVPGLLRALVVCLKVNPALGAGVLLATSVLFYYPVPPGISPSGPGTYVVSASGLTARVSIRPDTSGPNTVSLTLMNKSGRPVSEAHISVLTTMLDMVMGTGLANLHETSPAQFSGTLDLAMGGRWRLIFLVYQPNGLTHLAVDTRVGT